jgi:hypothetical protein
MSATMARKGGCVQLEQSDMGVVLNMAKIAQGRFSCAAIKEMQYLIKKPCAEVREENTLGVDFRWHQKVKAAIARQTAMLC